MRIVLSGGSAQHEVAMQAFTKECSESFDDGAAKKQRRRPASQVDARLQLQGRSIQSLVGGDTEAMPEIPSNTNAAAQLDKLPRPETTNDSSFPDIHSHGGYGGYSSYGGYGGYRYGGHGITHTECTVPRQERRLSRLIQRKQNSLKYKRSKKRRGAVVLLGPWWAQLKKRFWWTRRIGVEM